MTAQVLPIVFLAAFLGIVYLLSSADSYIRGVGAILLIALSIFFVAVVNKRAGKSNSLKVIPKNRIVIGTVILAVFAFAYGQSSAHWLYLVARSLLRAVLR